MQNSVGFLRVVLQSFDGLGGRNTEQFNLAALGLAQHFPHDRQSAIDPSAHHQPAAVPRYLFGCGKWRVPRGVAELLGRFLLTLADLTAVDYHVVVIGDPADSDRTEGRVLEAHMRLPLTF